MISYLEHNGLLGPRLNIVHSVWITRREMDRMAAADAGIVLNHLSNTKLKSGIAPVCDLREAGVRLGLGCDNCSGSDVQSVFQAMKLFCLFAVVSEPEPGPALAHEVLRHATLGNARTAGLAGCLGAIKEGHKADLILIDLKDPAYLPYNSAARQLVYTESGRGVDMVLVDGKIVVQDRKVTTIDEDALRAEVADLMKFFIPEYEAVVKSRKRAMPYMVEAHRQMLEVRRRYEPLHRPNARPVNFTTGKRIVKKLERNDELNKPLAYDLVPKGGTHFVGSWLELHQGWGRLDSSTESCAVRGAPSWHDCKRLRGSELQKKQAIVLTTFIWSCSSSDE